MSEKLDKLVFDNEYKEEVARKTSKSRVAVVLVHEEDKENQPLDEMTTEDTDVISLALTKLRKREHRRKLAAKILKLSAHGQSQNPHVCSGK